MITSMTAVIEHDLRVFFKYRFTLAGLISMNLADLLIMGVVFTNMVSFNYFRFLAPGIVSMGLFALCICDWKRSKQRNAAWL